MNSGGGELHTCATMATVMVGGLAAAQKVRCSGRLHRSFRARNIVRCDTKTKDANRATSEDFYFTIDFSHAQVRV